MNTIPALTKFDIDSFVATHEFNEVGQSEWFRLKSYGGAYREPKTLWGRKFRIEQVLLLAVGLDKEFQARLIE